MRERQHLIHNSRENESLVEKTEEKSDFIIAAKFIFK